MTDFRDSAKSISPPGSAGWVDRLLTRWCAGRPTREIRINDQPYLLRVYVAHWRGWRVYLHRFVSADGDRFLHDHPFRSVAVVLSGGYVEERLLALDLPTPLVRCRAVRWLNFLAPRTFHRIARVDAGTWTLFIHSPHRKSWGFLMPSSVGYGLLYTNPFDQTAQGQGAQWWAAAGTPTFAEILKK